MNNPNVKAVVSEKRKRNFLVKKMRESGMFKKKIHDSEKDRDKQRKWRVDNEAVDAEHYEQLDDFLMRGITNGEET